MKCLSPFCSLHHFNSLLAHIPAGKVGSPSALVEDILFVRHFVCYNLHHPIDMRKADMHRGAMVRARLQAMRAMAHGQAYLVSLVIRDLKPRIRDNSFVRKEILRKSDVSSPPATDID